MVERHSLVCIGHSHVDAVSAAAARAAVSLETSNIWNLAGAAFGPAAVQAVREIRPQLRAPVFSFVGGGLPQVFGMIAHPRRPYDFVLPEQPELPVSDGMELVPYDALHASMQASIRPFFAIMDEIRDVTEGPVFHMESPPPCEEEIKAIDPGWSAFYAVDDVIAPIWFRYKIWRLHSNIVRAYCNGANIVFVPHPREAADARGFLDPAFRGKPGHGNLEYGALVLQQMRALSAAAGTL
jgi:hypothetical protein